jgi:hypothetical protein
MSRERSVTAEAAHGKGSPAVQRVCSIEKRMTGPAETVRPIGQDFSDPRSLVSVIWVVFSQEIEFIPKSPFANHLIGEDFRFVADNLTGDSVRDLVRCNLQDDLNEAAAAAADRPFVDASR